MHNIVGRIGLSIAILGVFSAASLASDRVGPVQRAREAGYRFERILKQDGELAESLARSILDRIPQDISAGRWQDALDKVNLLRSRYGNTQVVRGARNQIDDYESQARDGLANSGNSPAPANAGAQVEGGNEVEANPGGNENRNREVSPPPAMEQPEEEEDIEARWREETIEARKDWDEGAWVREVQSLLRTYKHELALMNIDLAFTIPGFASQRLEDLEVEILTDLENFTLADMYEENVVLNQRRRPYVVDGDVYIMGGFGLRIDKGVEIIPHLMSDYLPSIVVEGDVKISGDKSNPVVIDSVMILKDTVENSPAGRSIEISHAGFFSSPLSVFASVSGFELKIDSSCFDLESEIEIDASQGASLSNVKISIENTISAGGISSIMSPEENAGSGRGLSFILKNSVVLPGVAEDQDSPREVFIAFPGDLTIEKSAIISQESIVVESHEDIEIKDSTLVSNAFTMSYAFGKFSARNSNFAVSSVDVVNFENLSRVSCDVSFDGCYFGREDDVTKENFIFLDTESFARNVNFANAAQKTSFIEGIDVSLSQMSSNLLWDMSPTWIDETYYFGFDKVDDALLEEQRRIGIGALLNFFEQTSSEEFELREYDPRELSDIARRCDELIASHFEGE
ncbi:MAG: hypothetical protein NUW37_01945 [Planctomycetes bacterium]|nr:hypothetical protein [Planctomycetota bacterium]